jgi:hypothetical protein
MLNSLLDAKSRDITKIRFEAVEVMLLGVDIV